MSQRTASCVLTLLVLLSAGCGGETATKSSKVIAPPKSAPATPAPAQAAPVAEAAAKPAMAEPAAPAAVEPAAPAAETPAPAKTEVAAKAAEQPAAAPAGQGTTIKGRVVVKGDVAKVPPIVPSKDEVCIAVGEITNDRVVVGEGGGLANVFVWLKRFPKGAEIPKPADDVAVLDQKGCQFIPKAMTFQIGQRFIVKNDDPTLHNTHTVPFVNSPGFNQGIQPNDREGQEIEYRRSEIIPVTTTCDIHPWMKSFHLPLEHPWSAVTDETGAFEITGLPAGDLEFSVWHESGWVEKSLKLTMADGQFEERTFEVDAASLAE